MMPPGHHQVNVCVIECVPNGELRNYVQDMNHMDHIYLDHNATTPADPAVVEAMMPYFSGVYGNASSVHSYGRDARVALEKARETVAEFVGAETSEIYFTSGATEADNIAVKGVAYNLRKRKNHVIVGATEHSAILQPAEYLHEREGFDLDILPVNGEGFALKDKLAELINDKTAVISVMHGNHEMGAINDIAALSAIARDKGVLFHTDAVQTTGKVPVNVQDMGVDMMSLSGHKIYGPKGIGAIYIRQGVKVLPLFHGGPHEKKRRPGTENVAGAVGLARALELAANRREEDFTRLWDLSNSFIDRLQAAIPDVTLNSPRENRVPQTVNLAFAGVEGESTVLSLDMKGVAVSSGSACSSGSTGPSPVLSAMNISPALAQSSIRFSLGRSTTPEQIDRVLEILPPIIERLRSMSPTYG